MRLLFIRHGHPDYAKDCLTELGHAQAEAAAKRLSTESIDAILSSSCGRAVETAEHTAAYFHLPVAQSDSFREVGWGPAGGPFDRSYQPWTAAETLARTGEDLLTYDYASFREWGGSSTRESYEKVARGFDEWIASYGYIREGAYYRCVSECDKTLALFAHAGSGTCLFAHLFGLPAMYLFGRVVFTYTSISEVQFSATAGELCIPSLTIFNEHEHIKAVDQVENVFGR